MPFALLKYGLSADYPVEVDLPPPCELKPRYDVVIIGGGGHGVAIAYYLAKYHGITNVAVLEKAYGRRQYCAQHSGDPLQLSHQ